MSTGGPGSDLEIETVTVQSSYFPVGDCDMTLVQTEGVQQILIDMNIRSDDDDPDNDTPVALQRGLHKGPRTVTVVAKPPLMRPECPLLDPSPAHHHPALVPTDEELLRLGHTPEERMTVRTTLSFTDRHHRFLLKKVSDGIFATQSAAVANAIERMMQDEEEREVALSALAEEIRLRIRTARSKYVDRQAAFSSAHAAVEASRGK